MNILVSGASGIVGYGTLKSLRMAYPDANLIGTTIYEDSIAPAFCDVFERAVPTTSPDYISWLCLTIEKHQIDFIIPGIEADLYSWTEHKKTIEASGTKILLNKEELINLCHDKWCFYQTLIKENSNYSIPTSLEDNFDKHCQTFGLPFLLKPRIGFASKGIVRVDNEEAYEKFRSQIGSKLMVQPIIGNDGEEYTAAVFGDGSGSFVQSFILKRSLSTEGFTEKAEVILNENIDKALRALCLVFKPVGPTNFQFRMENQVPKLLEINPRISSSTSIRAAFNYNEAEMSVEHYVKNMPLKLRTIKFGKAIRYVEDFIEYDSTNI